MIISNVMIVSIHFSQIPKMYTVYVYLGRRNGYVIAELLIKEASMTANQLQYQANVENARHNQAAEIETKRHNEATEKLTADMNSIERDKQITTASYQTRLNELTAEYNKQSLALQSAIGSEKNRISGQLADIEQQKADAEAAYKQRMSELTAQEVDVKVRSQDEVKRHNVNTEKIETARLTEGSWAEQRLYEYNQAYLGSQTGYWTGLLSNATLTRLQEGELGRERNRIASAANEINTLNAQVGLFSNIANIKQKKSDMWAHTVTEFGTTLIKTAGLIGSKLVVGGK